MGRGGGAFLWLGLVAPQLILVAPQSNFKNKSLGNSVFSNLGMLLFEWQGNCIVYQLLQ